MLRPMEVCPEVAKLAIDVALAYRDRTKGPRLKPTGVSVFCLADENELTKELVLKVHGTGSVLRIVTVPKRERMGGLFEHEQEPEQVREVEIGEDFVYVYEEDLPVWAAIRVARDVREGNC